MPTEIRATTADREKLLFTPGPLTTSATVKQAMLHDLGSRDVAFIEAVRDIRQRLLRLAGQPDDRAFTAVLMQGSGTFGIESVIGSVIPRDGKLLVIVNGAYGQRIVRIAEVLGIAHRALVYPENELPDLAELERCIANDLSITTVAAVHCETTTGILNPVEQIGEIVSRYSRVFIVDAMSSFGAIPLDVASARIHYLVSSANKCIEGVPGFSFVIAHRRTLQSTAGYARSLSLDLLAQWLGLESNGQFRFTPPVQALLAFLQALRELDEEGGVAGRAERYLHNHLVVYEGMKALGFQPYLDTAHQSYIITTFYEPQHPNFDFVRFYELLSDQGYVIYPGKLTQAACFRIGNIGRLTTEHMHELLAGVRDALDAMGVTLG